MSTSIAHQPDTPVSSGSPSSIGNNDAGDSLKLDCFHKNDERLQLQERAEEGSCCSSPPINEDRDCHSGSSSPASSRITPNLSFTPPANGILTPPNDSELGNESLKSNKGAGRLKFYKDGVLCLELSHNDEGAKRKWVQIRTKTVFPTVVHTKKEVIIPRHVSPSPSFHSPLSVTNSLHQRLESSGSHSTSDDGSSMLSSPRIRESRKPVPHKGISLCLEFYLKPGRCILKYRKHSKNFYHSGKYYRKPYHRTASENTIPNSPFKCLCDISPIPGTLEKTESETADQDMVDGSLSSKGKLATFCDPVSINENEKKKQSTKPSILELVQKLHEENEKHLKLSSNQNKLYRHHHRLQDANIKRVSATPTDQSFLPKKRSFRDTDVKDPSTLSTSSIRPKMSPKSKTILNIPGFNNEFSKRSTVTPEGHNELEKSSSRFVGPSSISSTHDNGKNLRHGEVSATRKKSSTNRPSSQQGLSGTDYTTGSPLVKIPRRSPSSPKHSPNNSTKFPSQSQSAMYLSSLPPEQQQLFQQQTMSKAISYTINSLLSSHNQEPSKNSPAVDKIIKPHEKANISKRDIGGAGGGSNQMPHGSNYFGIKGDHDQNSFLRHLLDTSDPIPQVTGKVEPPPVTSTNSSSKSKQSQQESDAYLQQHHSSKPSSHKDDNNRSINRKLPKESKSGKEKLSQPGRSVPPPPQHQRQPALAPQFQHQLQQMGFYPPSAAAFLQHPGLFGGGFPLGHLQGYESLFGGQNPSVNSALAAAAELQYQSLLPPNFLSMNPQMAAAMAASYLGASQPSGYPPLASANSLASRSPQPPTIARGGRSENCHSSNRQSSSKGTPLNLSHREREGSASRFHNGIIHSTSIPVPFHAPTSDNQHPRNGSGSASSRGRFVAKSAHEVVYDDVPLNLSKK